MKSLAINFPPWKILKWPITKHALRIEMGYKKTGVAASFLALLDNVLHFSYVAGAT